MYKCSIHSVHPYTLAGVRPKDRAWLSTSLIVRMNKKKGGDAGRSDNSTTLASAMQQDEYKVIIIGALGAGKTSLLLRYVHDKFEDRISRFVSEERKVVTVGDKEIVLDIWDTAGKGREGEESGWGEGGGGRGGRGG